MSKYHKPIIPSVAALVSGYRTKVALFGGASALVIGLICAPGATMAQDAQCLDKYSVIIAPPPSTDLGQENPGGFNSTCDTSASAFGFASMASTEFSSAFGYNSRALGNRSNAIGLATTARGDGSSAIGSLAETGSDATGSLAVGTWYDVNLDNIIDLEERTWATGAGSAAVGVGAQAHGFRSYASGISTLADGELSTSVGAFNNVALVSGVRGLGGARSTAVGYNNSATGANATAVGHGNVASFLDSSAVGFRNTASGWRSVAVGYHNAATGDRSVALGAGNNQGDLAPIESGMYSSAVGFGNQAFGDDSSAFGDGTIARADFSSAFGFQSSTGAGAIGGLAVGGWADINSNGVIETGELTSVNGKGAVAVGNGAIADGEFSAAFGVGAVVDAAAARGTAIGINARVTAIEGTAIGWGAIADRAGAVSVGALNTEHNIIHVADAVAGTDAVNLRQMVFRNDAMGSTLAQILGGGMAYSETLTTLTTTFPVFSIQSATYNTVGSALAAIDQRLTTLAGGAGGVGPQGPAGPQGPGNPLSPAYDDAARDTMTLEGANGTRLANVADGVAPTDAANVRQVQAGNAQTLSAAQTYADAGDAVVKTYADTRDAVTLNSAQTYADAGDTVVKAYADTRDAVTLNSARTYADAGDTRTLQSAMAYTDQKLSVVDNQLAAIGQRLDGQERRIDRMGAMSSAQLNMAMNVAGSVAGRGRLGVGLGFQNGEEALSVGYGRRLGNGVSISVGGAFGRHGEQSGGVGIGFDIF